MTDNKIKALKDAPRKMVIFYYIRYNYIYNKYKGSTKTSLVRPIIHNYILK